ncbi:MAG: hypothetical protein LC128_05740 [Chitinophagales bacterium]|nr:hypothetical protein [Chitinophagales bacterium]
MKKDDTFQMPFSDAVLTSVFVGFCASIACLLYNLVVRERTGLELSGFINVSTLIFSVNLIFVVIGLIYSLFVKNSKRPELIFILIFLALIVFLVIKSGSVVRSPDPEIASQFRTLLMGIVIIIGVGIVLIPFLFHSQKFRDAVL